MKKRAIKLISLILAVVIVSSCAIIAGVSASAATGVVYFDNSVTNYSTVYCYMWGGSSGANHEWPGEAMTKADGDVWYYNASGDYANVIFNNGSGAQSADLTFPGGGQIAKPDSADGKFNVSWSAYSGDTPVIPDKPTTPQPTTPSGGAGTVYCQNDAGWGSVTCYMWNSENDKNAAWPGVAMTSIGDGVWEYSYSKKYANVIFSASGNNQTPDMTFPGDSQIYNNSTNQWEPYSSSPVKIKSFATDIESPAYTGCEVVLSANATSSAGTVVYKFSADGAVLSESTSSSVVWVPTKAGTYKLTLDAYDTAGNTNTRSLSFTVNDPSGLETAFIKAFKNTLGTRAQIKQNTAVTFTMDALGGHTGNGKLFYKFLITEPDSKTNIAYYTTNNSYTYTPTKLGKYVVKAFVQNSYNATVTKEYTYTSVTVIDEQTNPTPTTPVTPTTAPATSPATQPPTAPVNPTTEPVKPTTPPETTPTIPGSQFRLGDANHDGEVNIMDVTFIQKHVAGMIDSIDTTVADTNHDGYISIKDATQIQYFIAGMASTLTQ